MNFFKFQIKVFPVFIYYFINQEKKGCVDKKNDFIFENKKFV